jgi:hypothetical protein
MSLASNLTNETSATTSEPAASYDEKGAAMYIAVILIWYSTGLALMLFLQMRPRNHQNPFAFDSSKTHSTVTSRRNPMADYHHVQADNRTKQILNELKDPERRQRLWKIYYSSTEQENEPHPQYYQTITTDNATIGRINRKLATIHRLNPRHQEEGLPLAPNTSSNDNRLTSGFETVKFFPKRFISQRRPADPVMPAPPPPPPPTLFRAQSQPDAATSNSMAESDSLLESQQPSAPLTNGSRKRPNKFLDRFTVEKVLENSRTCSVLKENASE